MQFAQISRYHCNDHFLTEICMQLDFQTMPGGKKVNEADASKGKVLTRSSKGDIVFLYLPVQFKLFECKTIEHANELLLKTPQEQKKGSAILRFSNYHEANKK